MARYIDADKFIERLKASPAFPNMGMDGYFLLDVVENLLKKFPTADVAPKSEVIEEYRKKVYSKMEKYTVFGREYIQRIMREVEKEMKGGE